MKNQSDHPLAARFDASSVFLRITVACAVIFGPAFLVAASEDARNYFSIRLDALTFIDGEALSEPHFRQSFPSRLAWNDPQAQRFPYVWIEGAGDAYIAPRDWPRQRTQVNRQDLFLAVDADPGKTVRGILFHPLAGPDQGFARLPFEIEPGDAAKGTRDDFLNLKARHYERLTSGGYIGGGWFRHQLNEAEEALNPEHRPPLAATPHQRGSGLDQTFDLFSGGRAISENLALDDTLDIQDRSEEYGQPLAEIRGITIQEYDWQDLLDEPPASVDPLARLIPADQHALFLRDGAALITFLDEWQRNGLPLLSLFDPVSVPAGLIERYEHQLGISLDDLAGFSTEGRVRSIAITGGDPFFATGTDVAILLETDDPLALLQHFENTFRAIADRESGVEFTRFDEGHPELVLMDPDRSRSARITVADDALVITNSPLQIEAVARVTTGASQAIADLDEYLFFRARYSPADTGETGFLLLTDDTIRRWCSPEWRIGASRRLRAAALLSDLSARHLPALVAGSPATAFNADAGEAEWLGTVKRTANGVRSERYNHLGFLTPISELKIETVSAAEAQAYESWRRRYEAEWQEAFDPIAIRFSLSSERMGVDMTVMPLTASSQYRRSMELAGTASIAPGSGDPRTDALLQIALAVDPDSEPMRMLTGMGAMFGTDLSYNVLGWMSGTVSLYLDESVFWHALAEEEDPEGFLMRNFGMMPAALHIDSRDPVRLALFLSSMRTLIEQASPGMILWETREYEGQPYIAIVPTESMVDTGMPPISLFYAARPDALVISFQEEVIRRSIGRYQEHRANDGRSEPEWLGQHLNLNLRRTGVSVFQSILSDEYEKRLHAMAQAPVPLLNDWRMRFPEADPLQLMRAIRHYEAACPAGGEYVWNDEYKTYESSSLGHTASPRAQAGMPVILEEMESLQFGISFEHDGVRARGELRRTDGNTESVTDNGSDVERKPIDIRSGSRR